MKDFFSMRSSENWDLNEENRPYWRKVFEHFASFEGMVVDYFGADESSNEFKLDTIVWKVLEDPDDGYRSHLGVIEYGDQSDSIFFRKSLGKVRIETYSDNKECPDGFYEPHDRVGYRLVDISDGHVWLEFGTENTDDYYPYFIFRHMPKDIEIETSR